MSRANDMGWSWSAPEPVRDDDVIVHGQRWRRERDAAVSLLVEALENEDVLLTEDPDRPINDWSARARALTNHPDPRDATA